MRLNTCVSPVGATAMSGAFAANHSCARASTASISAVVASASETEMRMAERSTLIWSVRSMP